MTTESKPDDVMHVAISAHSVDALQRVARAHDLDLGCSPHLRPARAAGGHHELHAHVRAHALPGLRAEPGITVRVLRNATADGAAETVWRPKYNPWLIAVVVALAAFMEVLDGSIANVALPYMAGSMAASNDESTWVLTSYLVSNAIVLPMSGWLAVTFGRKRFFMGCLAIFTLSSLLCGVAPSLATLLLFRVVQGGGGGGLHRNRGAAAAAGGATGAGARGWQNGGRAEGLTRFATCCRARTGPRRGRRPRMMVVKSGDESRH